MPCTTARTTIRQAPTFERPARPDASLSAFSGEVSQGTWTLRMCDLLPGVNDGAYHAGRLSLTPQGRALSSAGTWATTLRTPEGHDGVTHTLAIYGLDEVGNRTVEPISLTYRLDTVAPVLTVTTALTRSPLLDPPPVLAGQVSDGGGLEGVYARVDPPDGASYRDSATDDGLNWTFTLRATDVGTHTLWLEAYDEAGNTTKRGPYTVEVYDNVPPEIGARAPDHGAVGVSLTATVAYAVAPDPGGWSVAWDTLSQVVTLTHATFAYGTRVTVTITAADDLAGNPLASAPVVWRFDTLAEPDTVAPEIVTVQPPDTALNVALTAPVVITFSEAISTGTFAYGVSPDPGGWGAAWDEAGLVVTLTHAPFVEATWYTVTVTAADDLSGNPLASAPVAWAFATPGAPDIMPP